jgi:nucleoside-diphosphate-sugar epimerase
VREREKGAVERALPTILVTGASGLVGRHFIETARESCFVHAVARRSRKDAGVQAHDNVRWLRCDIGDGQSVSRLFDSLAAEGPVDYLFHFAGYYDFSLGESPEYRRTNVEGTRFLLENAGKLNLKRFVFSSSLAVTDFSDPDRVIDEQSPPDAEDPYAVSKRQAEKLVEGYAENFPCTIARLAAIFSDWCEYGPLYSLLGTWLSGGLRANCVAGRGETALPYLHVQDLNSFWMGIMEKHETLSNFDILAAGPDGCVSHGELYASAARYCDGGAGRVRYVPVPLAALGILLMRLAGRLTGRPPFERLWMTRYIDRRMVIDASATRRLLEWTLKPRFHIMRRLLFLVENRKRDPLAWERKNLAMTKEVVVERPGLKIYNAMMDLKESLVSEHVAYLTAAENRNLYPRYQRLETQELRLRAELMYQMVESSIRVGDHLSILSYANYLARRRYREGVPCEELTGSLEHLAYRIESALNGYRGLDDMKETIHYEIVTSMQLIVDEVEDVYDNLTASGEKITS